jgi:hypothetical protein
VPTPSRIVGEVLTYHPEAASLLGEASHRHALAVHSTATASQALYAAQSMRVCYEELRHRLDPRYRRPVHFAAGLAFLAGLGLGLTVLDGLELMTVLAARMAVPISLAAVAVWITGAWLAALAAREGRRGLLAGIIAGAVVMGLLLITLHGFMPFSNRPMSWGHIAVGALLAALISALVTGTAVVIARMEPASVYLARQRWQRARTLSEAAVGLEQADAEAAAIAREAWLGLVRAQASAIARDGDTHVLQDTLTLASALQEANGVHPDQPGMGP